MTGILSKWFAMAMASGLVQATTAWATAKSVYLPSRLPQTVEVPPARLGIAVIVPRGASVRTIGEKTTVGGSPVRNSVTSGETASVANMQTSDHDGVLVVAISGELDMISVDAVGTALFEHLAKQPDGLVVELAVDFMGSSALSMLLELHGRAQHEKVGFAIVATAVAAARPLMASALTQVLPVAQSVDEAVKSIQEERKPG